MLTESEIRSNYKAAHDALTSSYYSGETGLTKEEFDDWHGSIWSGLREELIASGYLTPSLPGRDLASEIDALKKRIGLLEDVGGIT